jgi:hypothetical protein
VRRLPVNAGGHDLPMQPLQRPAVLHEVDGQPIQQLGMRR